MPALTEELIEKVLVFREELQGLTSTDYIHCQSKEDTEVARKYSEKHNGEYQSRYPSGFLIGDLKIFDYPGDCKEEFANGTDSEVGQEGE